MLIERNWILLYVLLSQKIIIISRLLDKGVRGQTSLSGRKEGFPSPLRHSSSGKVEWLV